jgi:hypothetical protein
VDCADPVQRSADAIRERCSTVFQVTRSRDGETSSRNMEGSDTASKSQLAARNHVTLHPEDTSRHSHPCNHNVGARKGNWGRLPNDRTISKELRQSSKTELACQRRLPGPKGSGSKCIAEKGLFRLSAAATSSPGGGLCPLDSFAHSACNVWCPEIHSHIQPSDGYGAIARIARRSSKNGNATPSCVSNVRCSWTSRLGTEAGADNTSSRKGEPSHKAPSHRSPKCEPALPSHQATKAPQFQSPCLISITHPGVSQMQLRWKLIQSRFDNVFENVAKCFRKAPILRGKPKILIRTSPAQRDYGFPRDTEIAMHWGGRKFLRCYLRSVEAGSERASSCALDPIP